ncbi:hypothetical protein, partial [Salinivibrio costicola]|uniref:hypothetical protein n=1 Tax=Salinivibrio costicola TaxID=51367 RepID=UPI001F2027F3
ASGAKVGLSITKLTGTEVANLNSRRDTRSDKRRSDVNHEHPSQSAPPTSRSNLASALKLAPIVTGAPWQCAHTHHRAGACVTYANGTINV